MTIQIGGNQHSRKSADICSFLGLEDDEQTSLAFPSDWNVCHHCKPVNSIKLDHQRIYCLSHNHKNCIVYILPSIDVMPRELRGRRLLRAQPGNRAWKTILVFFIVLFVVLGLFFSTQIRSYLFSGFPELAGQPVPIIATSIPVQASPSPELIPSPTRLIPPPSATPSMMPTLSFENPVETTLPTLQVTATITRIPRDIGTLIGINHVFKIHRVTQGENLELLAYLNSTTVAAIFAVNDKFVVPLQPQQMIVIPINQTDVSDLPPFEPYRVTESISLEVLAGQLGVDSGQLQYYNGLGIGIQLQEGEWIIVPREKNAVE